MHNLIRALKYVLPYKWHLAALIAASLLFSATQAGGILLIKDGVDAALKNMAPKKAGAIGAVDVRVRLAGLNAKGQMQYVLNGTQPCVGHAALLRAIREYATLKDVGADAAADLRIRVAGQNADNQIKYVLNGTRTCVGNEELIQAIKELASGGPGEAAPENDGSRQLWIIGGMLLLVALGRGLFSYIQAYLSSYVSNRVSRSAQNQVMQKMVGMPLAFFHAHRTGEILSRMGRDSEALRKTVKLSTDVIKEPITLAGAIGIVFWMNWKLALIGFTGFPLALWPMILLSRKMRKASRKSREKAADMSSLMLQIFGGIRLVRAYGQEQAEHGRYVKTNQELFRQEMKATRARALTRPIVEILSSLGLAAVVVVGGQMVIQGAVEPAQIVGFMAALISMYNPAKSLAKDNEDIQDVIPGAERFFHLLDAPNTMPDDPSAAVAPARFEAIEIKNLTFSYVPGTPVLKNINLRIGSGRTVALVGHTGAGKSTLADLVCRFYDPQEGGIEIDGLDLRRIRQRSLFSRIAIVPQEPFLFNDTIRANILYGKPGADQAEIEAAARAAAIHAEIAAMPKGYATVVGERGNNLSGGQRQRVSIARALLRNAPILILDEATSSLDSESELLVQQAVERLLAGRTTLIIAHRLSTIRHADLIVVLSDGRIEDLGSHDELLARSATYSRFWQMQSRGSVPAIAP